MSDAVYEQHKANVAGKVRYEKPREEDGAILDELIKYSYATLTAEESDPAWCATFEAFDYVCKIISARSGVKITRVYPGLRAIGYNWRYHDMKTGNPDALCGMGERVKTCMMGGDPGIMPFVSNSKGLFTGTHNVQFRVSRKAMGIADDDASDAGVSRAELNLYNALEGLTRLCENSTIYRNMLENLYFDETLTVFSFIKQRLVAKKVIIERILGV